MSRISVILFRFGCMEQRGEGKIVEYSLEPLTKPLFKVISSTYLS
jgi:hypothetical protein